MNRKTRITAAVDKVPFRPDSAYSDGQTEFVSCRIVDLVENLGHVVSSVGKAEMEKDLSRRLAEANEKAATKEQLRQLRVQTEDQFTQESYRRECLEAYGETLDREIAKLENPGLTGLLTTLLGSSHQKLERIRFERVETTKAFDGVSAVIESVQGQLSDLDRQLQDLEEAETEYAALLEARERSILESGGEAAQRFSEIAQQLECVKDQLRKTERAIQEGEAVRHRVITMNRALERSRKKRMFVLGAIDVSMAWNAVQTQTAKPLVNHVRQGLQRLHAAVSTLDLSAGTDVDIEITRLMSVIEQLGEEMAGGWTGGAIHNRGQSHSVEDEIQSMLNELHTKLDMWRRQADDLEGHKRQVIETA